MYEIVLLLIRKDYQTLGILLRTFIPHTGAGDDIQVGLSVRGRKDVCGIGIRRVDAGFAHDKCDDITLCILDGDGVTGLHLLQVDKHAVSAIQSVEMTRHHSTSSLAGTWPHKIPSEM